MPSRQWFPALIAILWMTSGAMAAAPSPPIFRSATGQFTLLRPIDPAPNATIYTLDGTTADLSGFRGRVIVLNFWASWCVPCIYEMPLLDRLAAKSDPNRLAVIAVSIDRGGAAAVAPFLKAHGLTHLAIYLDPDQHLGSFASDQIAVGALPLWGLPITYIVDKQGEVLGYLTGAANWDSPESQSFLDYFLRHAAP